ncbi:N-acyl-D-amino-acid deacylase family protein [Nitrospirillum iridis]|uniref:N-acyl-D-amino-acid deacylase n=1 Tax=Nitrospirillum iridis TaxID=765888 RepID=A0A7X0EEJ7_9PROT|nr:D-aminoacylase [Nitrospirillum iridis]MBB6252136.1 N-acyl-D-amino-acid deacylase [Nitrospirillum iridis]
MKQNLAVTSVLALSLCAAAGPSSASPAQHDVLIQGGTIYDGTGGEPYVGDVAIDQDRISYVGPHQAMTAKRVIDARGRAVSPGFINMLSQAQESLLVDGRGESDLVQGVTLEVTGEGTSMGPLSDAMAERDRQRQGDTKFPITWRSLGDYLQTLEKKGISLNIASMVGAATVRDYVLGEGDVQPGSEQLGRMQELVRQAMTDGALGVSSALIYAPGTFAKTPELIALATEAGRCGGIYITHMRSEGNDLLGALDETIAIAKASGAPAEVYHLKVAGKANWSKLDAALGKIEGARAAGVRLTADLYPYTAGATGFDAAMPHWVLDGGLEAWIARLKDPEARARVVKEMQNPPPGFESALVASGPEGALLLQFKNEKLKPLTGKTLAEVAKARGVSPEEAVIDLVIEDGSRIGVAYTVMSEDNVRKEIAQPWVSFASDEAATAPEGVFLRSAQHPRAYGTFAKVLAHYVRDEKIVPLKDAIHRLSGLPAANLSLKDRGLLKQGYFADVVVFDPATIQDHATFANAQQLATGVQYVFVNGGAALDDGKVTPARAGRVVRGQGWRGWPNGGCRSSSKDWPWVWG